MPVPWREMRVRLAWLDSGDLKLASNFGSWEREMGSVTWLTVHTYWFFKGPEILTYFLVCHLFWPYFRKFRWRCSIISYGQLDQASQTSNFSWPKSLGKSQLICCFTNLLLWFSVRKKQTKHIFVAENEHDSGKIASWEDVSKILQGSWKGPIFGDQTMQIYGNLIEFPYNSSLFGLVYNARCIRMFIKRWNDHLW